jgi:hypothetical protein
MLVVGFRGVAIAKLFDQVGPVDHGCVAIAASPDPVESGVRLDVLARAFLGGAVPALCRAVPRVATVEDVSEPLAVAGPMLVLRGDRRRRVVVGGRRCCSVTPTQADRTGQRGSPGR